MQITNLEAFITLNQCRSFSRAAHILFISQSALTQRIIKMEDELGFTLVDHQRKNSFQLTPAGERFLRFAEETVRSYKDTLYDCEKLKSDHKQHFTIGIEQFDMHYLSREKISTFQNNLTNTVLHFEYSMHADLLDHLYRHDFDCVFLAKPAALPGEYAFTEITTDDFLCVYRDKLELHKDGLHYDDISNHPIYLPKDSYTDFINLEQDIRLSHPNTKFHTYQTINFLSPDQDSCIYITNAGKEFIFQELNCSVLQTSQKLHLGFVYRKDVNKDLIKQLINCATD